jgi:hypothetical protein
MDIISKGLIGVGLLITVAGNLTTYYGVRTAVNGMLNAEANGIGAVASGMSSAHTYSFVSLIGCLLLVIGLALAALRRRRHP